MSSSIVVFGCGHVGLVTAAGFAEMDHMVTGVDSDPTKIETLQGGIAPFYEPGLQELLNKHAGKNLKFTNDAAGALNDADAAFICVSTPPRHDGKLSLRFVEEVTRYIAETAPGPIVIVEKSTVPARTARRIMSVLQEHGRHDIEVASNPEFTAQGTSVADTLRPNRIVVGTNPGGRAESLLTAIYNPVVKETGCPLIVTDVETAEITKHAANSFLALKIAYINLVASACEQMGADVDTVARGIGLDHRIGRHFLKAGVGYGGSCFPKDVAGFIVQGREAGLDFSLLEEVTNINKAQRRKVLEKVKEAAWNLEGKLVAVWGLAFKPGTDDLREAPSVDVIAALESEGAIIKAYDPVSQSMTSTFPSVTLSDGALSAAQDAEVLVVLTEWPEFENIDLAKLKATMRRPIVVDGRNIWSADQMADAGFTYLSFGRPNVIAGQIQKS